MQQVRSGSFVPAIISAALSQSMTMFGWTCLDGIEVPFIQRDGQKFFPVRLAERKFLAQFANIVQYNVENPLMSHYMHETEALSLTNSGCGEIYTTQDLLVNLEEFTRFYEAVKEKCTKECSKKASVEGGWVQINNTVVPYIVKDDSVMIPLAIVRCAAGLLVGRDVPVVYPDEDECRFLNDSCKSAGIAFDFTPATELVELVLMSCMSDQRPFMRQLPSGNPFSAAEPVVEETSNEVSPIAAVSDTQPINLLPASVHTVPPPPYPGVACNQQPWLANDSHSTGIQIVDTHSSLQDVSEYKPVSTTVHVSSASSELQLIAQFVGRTDYPRSTSVESKNLPSYQNPVVTSLLGGLNGSKQTQWNNSGVQEKYANNQKRLTVADHLLYPNNQKALTTADQLQYANNQKAVTIADQLQYANNQKAVTIADQLQYANNQKAVTIADQLQYANNQKAVTIADQLQYANNRKALTTADQLQYANYQKALTIAGQLRNAINQKTLTIEDRLRQLEADVSKKNTQMIASDASKAQPPERDYTKPNILTKNKPKRQPSNIDKTKGLHESATDEEKQMQMLQNVQVPLTIIPDSDDLRAGDSLLLRRIQCCGRTITCMVKQDKLYILVEAMNRLYFPMRRLDTVIKAVTESLHLPVTTLTADEERDFMKFYKLPADKLNSNKVISVDDFVRVYRSLQCMLDNSFVMSRSVEPKAAVEPPAALSEGLMNSSIPFPVGIPVMNISHTRLHQSTKENGHSGVSNDGLLNMAQSPRMCMKPVEKPVTFVNDMPKIAANYQNASEDSSGQKPPKRCRTRVIGEVIFIDD